MNHHKKHIIVIGGSVRPDNYTMRAVALVEHELSQREDLSFEVVDAASLQLPLPGVECDHSSHEWLQARVREATGIILASPEYHGSVSSVMKLIIDNLGFPSSLAGKPVALLGVAAGVIGAIKSLEQMRSICSHIGGIVLPGPVSVASVHSVFDAAGKCLDEGTERRVRGVVTTLVDYIDDHICPKIALENMVREKEGI